MKILVCASEYYPDGSGIANVAYNLVEQLKIRHIDCVVCSPNGPDIRLGSAKLIKNYGILGLVYYWNEVYKYLEENKEYYNVIWCHNPLFLRKNLCDSCIVTMHSTYYGEFSHGEYSFKIKIYKKMASLVEKYCLQRLKQDILFTGVSSSVCQELEHVGIDKKRINYIPNGVDINLFKPSNNKNILRKKFSIPEENIVLLSLGRLTEVKRPFELIDVFSRIESKIKNITLVIAGDGELLDATKQFSKKLGTNNILFMGFVSHKNDAPDLYACSDYYIMASKYEGQPLTVLEALSSGLPCIVSDIPNLKFIEDLECGTTINFSNKEEAANNIMKFILNINSKNSSSIRMYAEKNLHWEIIANRYHEELTKLVVN